MEGKPSEALGLCGILGRPVSLYLKRMQGLFIGSNAEPAARGMTPRLAEFVTCRRLLVVLSCTPPSRMFHVPRGSRLEKLIG